MSFKIQGKIESKASGLVVERFACRSEIEAQATKIDSSSPVSVTPDKAIGLRKRLYGSDPKVDERIWPIRKYRSGKEWDESWSLYWMPLSFSNRSDTQIDFRFSKFLDLLLVPYVENSRLSKYTFFNSDLLYPHLIEHFVIHAMDYIPLPAIGFCPEEGSCRLPRPDELTKLNPHQTYEILQAKQQDFRMSDLFPQAPRTMQCIIASQDMAREKLTGRGGYSFAVSKFDQSEFFVRTKNMFLRNTTDEAMRRIPVVVPILSTTSFTHGLRTECQEFFSLFDIYVNESLKDRGVLIASSQCLDDLLPEFVEKSGLRDLGRHARFSLKSREPKW